MSILSGFFCVYLKQPGGVDGLVVRAPASTTVVSSFKFQESYASDLQTGLPCQKLGLLEVVLVVLLFCDRLRQQS